MGFLVNTVIEGQVFLINGSGPVASKRETQVAANGASSVQIADRVCQLADLTTLGREDVDRVVDGVFVVPNEHFTAENLQDLYDSCKRLRIPINVCEHPHLCTFSLPSVYEDGRFQLAVSTNGMGCRLANRVKRNCVNALPAHMGEICENVGLLRSKYSEFSSTEDEDDAEQSANLNELITSTKEDRKQKLRWLSQMVEYYPLDHLRRVGEEELTMTSLNSSTVKDVQNGGTISLVGAGPGHVGLLTTEALQDIHNADYVLADKLVPEEVLGLVPRQTPVFIARKFPGNAERAQQELLEIGLTQLQQGKRVVRLKQGDPYIYGRGLEEYIFFSDHGYAPKVVAGITSALAAPLLAQIAPTHRGYADQILICTGTGRGGKALDPPEYVDSRTYIFLMALHRIREMSSSLIDAGWDPALPMAAVERASCPDQRVIRSTLVNIAEAIDAAGSRPPGLLVVGRSCAVVHKLKPEQKWVIEEH